MDISHKYCYTNFEQLNIDFLLESVADHSNKITQLRTDLTAETAARTAEDTAIRADLQTEINTRIADVEALTAEDEALTAFANAIQADLNQEIADRAAAVAAEAAARTAEDDALTAFANDIQADLNQEIADRAAADTAEAAAREAISPVLFHLSYGQGGVLDCLPDEANDIMKAFDTDRRALVQFVDGTWYERINLVNRTSVQEAYFAKLTANSATWVSGGIIKLTHVAADDTHTFVSSGFSVDTAPIIIHAATTDSTPIASSTITTTDDLWDVQFIDKLTYIELTTAGNKSPMVYIRDGYYEVPEGVRSGDYDAYFNFGLWNDATKYVLTVHLEKADATDPTTWSASIHALRMIFQPT